MNLTEIDIEYLKEKGLNLEDVEAQVRDLKRGTQYLDITKPAVVNDGILHLSEEQQKEFLRYYEALRKSKSMVKFVPASGAATRMFKNLYAYLEDSVLTDYIQEFITNIHLFAFCKELESSLLLDGYNMDALIKEKKYNLIISFLLEEKGLNYGSLPKGLLSFHKCQEQVQTPIDEHLKEAKAYLGEAPKLVFTISEIYTSLFEQKIKDGVENLAFEIDYQLCYQKAKTDTIAVGLNFEIVKDEQNKILMRPGGHGSLISNLDEIDTDIIFIKNIDNVVSQSLLENNIQYKKILVGVLFSYQEQIFTYQSKLKDSEITADLLEEIYIFLVQNLGIKNFKWQKFTKKEKISYLKSKINRPLRVCGMVKNTGEPGGGPFWVSKNKEESLQIVESSQIDLSKEKYKVIFNKSSYFNPVDLVCAVKNYKGEKYNLLDFVDKNSFFISKKSYKGKDILALEHPGLWNGGMSDWNTVFVAVPLQTFAPVKMINDLLKEEHQ